VEAAEPAGWQVELDKLRDRMKDAPAARERGELVPARTSPVKPSRVPGESPVEDLKEKLAELPPLPAVDEPIVEALKKMSARIEALNLGPADGDQEYAEQVEAGQKSLVSGRFFDAEAQFSGALIARPGDPVAQVGRTHAQLSAGLFLSAAGNLRGLLTEHPEMIPVRYAASLRPSKERAEEIAKRLKDDLARKEASALGQDGALLLAYLGYQSENDAWLQQGLVEMRTRLNPTEVSGPRGNFVNVVDRIWFKPNTP